MNTGIYTVIGGLVVAAVSALAWLAYHDHTAFRRLGMVILLIVCGALLLIAGGVIGGSGVDIEALVDGLNRDPNSPIKTFAYPIEQLDHKRIMARWTLGLVWGISIYVVALGFLPKILGRDENGTPKDLSVGKPESSPKKRTKREAKKKSTDT